MRCKTTTKPGKLSKCILRCKMGNKPISLGFECDKYKHDFVLIQKERHQTVDFRWKKKLRKLWWGRTI